MEKNALVADVGGTQIRVAIVDDNSRVVYRKAIATNASEGRDAVLQRLIETFKDVALEAPIPPVGLGICMPGPIDPETGVLYNPPNLPGWDQISLKPVFEKEFSIEVLVGNDANCAALAEHRFGAGRGYKHVIYLTVSTGIGGGIIIDNKLYAGRKGFGAELGHVTIDRNGPRCNCGNVGCLEALASGTAVGRMARQRLSAGEASTMLELAGGILENVNAQIVSRAALSDDDVAKSIMDEVATNLGIGIVSILHIFDPDVIIIGGGMANSLEQLESGINAEIDRHAMGNFRGRRPIVKSELGDDVGILGAAALVFSRLDEN